MLMTRHGTHDSSPCLLFLLLNVLVPCGHGFSTKTPPPLQPLLQQGLLVHLRPDLFILGTVHLGSTSAQDVKLVLETLEPSKVIIEFPPSRLQRVRTQSVVATKNETSLLKALGTFPSLASTGLSIAGFSGMLVTIGLVWSSLVKRSLTSQEENRLLPRQNEFEVAVLVADSMGTEVVPADLEFDVLVRRISKAMTIRRWIQLAQTALKETIGASESDPINRKRGESMVDWERRRRQIQTARASAAYSKSSTPELHQVLVPDRDEAIARLCMKALDEEDSRPIVCVVGLVHVDGIVNILRDLLAN
eukprot:scaffold991_cov128-Cylindrotheca_fusiformis.AAC.19